MIGDRQWQQLVLPFFLLIGARQCWWFCLRATLGLNNPLWSDVSMNCQDKLLLNLPFGMPSVTLLLHIWHANGSHRQPRMLMATFSIWCLGIIQQRFWWLLPYIHYDSQHLIACSLMIWKDLDHLRAELKLFCCWFCLVIFIKRFFFFLFLPISFFSLVDLMILTTWRELIESLFGEEIETIELLSWGPKQAEIHGVFGQFRFNIFFIFIKS